MAAAYMHIGIPVTNKKPGMVYNEGARLTRAISWPLSGRTERS